MTKVLCIYHANCAEGLAAAWAVHRALGEGVEFVAAKYSGLHLDIRLKTLGGISYVGQDVLYVDFSDPLPVLRAMAHEARSVLVIDHHATAQKDLDNLAMGYPIAETNTGFRTLTHPEWLTRIVAGETNLAAIFDLDRSGAGLTWDYLHPKSANPLPLGHRHDGGSFGGGDQGECHLCGKDAILHEPRKSSRPRIIDLIEDRDLWKFRFGDETRAFYASLVSWWCNDLLTMLKHLDKLYEGEPSAVLDRDNNTWHEMLNEGRAILRAQSAAVQSAVAASRRTIRIAGHIVPCANVPGSMASDAGELLCQPTDGPSTPGYTDSIIVDDGAAQQNWPCFSATYYDGADGKRHFSLRSPDGGADVGRIAVKMAVLFNRTHEHIWQDTGKSFTGGGHEHAAGFDAPLGWEGEN